jgi:hypothetical protein
MRRFSGVGPTDLWRRKFFCEVKAELSLNKWSFVLERQTGGGGGGL